MKNENILKIDEIHDRKKNIFTVYSIFEQFNTLPFHVVLVVECLISEVNDWSMT